MEPVVGLVIARVGIVVSGGADEIVIFGTTSSKVTCVISTISRYGVRACGSD